jgi:hypothetical protein
MLFLTVVLGMALLNTGIFAVMLSKHLWILDAKGHPLVRDFVAYWAAGHQALRGNALAAYDPHLQHAAEAATIGHRFNQVLGWLYPPHFLFVASALACVPYTLAFVAWCALTATLYARVVGVIAESRIAFIGALAAPWALIAALQGQNGFLTAALIGLVLLQLESRPIVSGLILGFLSYKPQFGVLFPLALAAGGYWRAFGWAALSTLAWNGLAGAVFGFDTIGAFFHSLSLTTQTHLIDMRTGRQRLQSLYSLVHALGGSSTAAWGAQICVSMLVAVGVMVTWRAKISYSLKAAILAAAVPLATPYILMYDFPVLAVAIAFLHRHRDFDTFEFALLAAAVLCSFAYFWMPIPIAYFACVAVAIIAVRRCLGVLPRFRLSEAVP